MALTYSEEVRLTDLEVKINQLNTLITKAASSVMLERLLTLANEESRKTREEIDVLTIEVQTLISLAEKLQ